MKIQFYLCVIIGVLGSCTGSDSNSYVPLGDRLIEYQLQGDQYVVIIILDGITTSQAKQMARQRAAEITAMAGNRYFVIDQMYETEVIKSDEDVGLQGQRFYGNMYQELIIEGDFNKERLQYQAGPNTSMYSAIRLQFTTYKSRPSLKAIDACTLTKCSDH